MSDTAEGGLQIEGSSNFTPREFTIDPEDQHYADAILAQDPALLPGTFEIGEGVRLPDTIGIAGLPPGLREAAAAKLKGIPESRRAEAEASAVAEVLRDHSLEIRAKTGFAPSVAPYWAEHADIIREHNGLLKEFDRLTEAMTKVSRWETVRDAEGKQSPKPIYAMGADEQRLAAARQRELLHQMDLLVAPDGSHGIEGQRRLAKALHESVVQAKALKETLAIREEAKALAAKTLRDERVQREAESIARYHRPNL